MCGIVGIASSRSVMQREWLAMGRDAMWHRGPDGSGEWWSPDGRVGLAHRRLSIVDLSSGGQQPMSDLSGQVQIIFNGEIYNHVELRTQLIAMGMSFRSHSDTEVILVAYQVWGMDCLVRLNGMFSFALYDMRSRVLFLARDRAGEKPLFYRYVDHKLWFASELKALLVDPTIPRRIELESFDCYLAFGYVPGGRCILQGFQKLAAAHVLRFDLDSGVLNVRRYWQLPELTSHPVSKMDESLLLDELEILLEDAVSRQMMADVPVGVLLSGGIDSSLVTAMAARTSSHVKTFTVRFPGYGQFDETAHARLIARHFDTEHVELVAQQSTADLMPQLARQFDEPIVDSSMIPMFLVSQLVREHCKVVLGGDGGDELFGGYGHYSRLLWMQHYLENTPYAIRKVLSSMAVQCLPVGFKGRNWLQALAVNFDHGLPQIASYFDFKTRRRLMCGGVNMSASFADAIMVERVPQQVDTLQRATRMDYLNYLAEDILVKVDRSSMLNSLEVRAPFLDCRLIDFAFSKVPSYLKATRQDKKILLKQLACRVLPSQFDRHRKQGFSIPLAAWLQKGSYRTLFSDVLLDSRSIYDQRIVRQLLLGQDRGRGNSERLFALVLFELWRHEYGVTF